MPLVDRLLKAGAKKVLPASEREAKKAQFMAESADPRLFYHGTTGNIKEFMPRSKGNFVSPDPEFVNEFIKSNKSSMTGANVMPVRVQVKNPFNYENPEHIEALKREAFKDPKLSDYTRKWLEDEIDALTQIEGMSKKNNNWASIEHPTIQKLIKDLGHDSYYTSEFGVKNLSVYDPRKIKSDISNIGTYDINEADITKSGGGAVKISNNPDAMLMETLDRRFSEGGDKGKPVLKEPEANPYYKKAADILKWVDENIVSKQFGYANPVTEMLSPIDFKNAAKLMENKAYGTPIFNTDKANVPLLNPEARNLAMESALIAGPTKSVASNVRGMVPKVQAAMKRQESPLTMYLEAVSPQLGQRGTQGFKEGLTERLLDQQGRRGAVDISTIGGKKTQSRPAQGVFRSDETKKIETNPMRAVDIPGAGDVSKNPALRSDIASINEMLEQEALAASRFIPTSTARFQDASSVLIKPKSGSITPEQIKQLADRMDSDSVAVAHNPRLGGVVVLPIGEPGKQATMQLADAVDDARKVLGDEMSVVKGISDLEKDRLFATRKPNEYGAPTYQDYGVYSKYPEGKDTKELLDELKYMEKQVFPATKGALPGQAAEAPSGGVQPWSRGTGYPMTVMGVGEKWSPLNAATGQRGGLYDKIGPELDRDFQEMLDLWHRGLPSKLD